MAINERSSILFATNLTAGSIGNAVSNIMFGTATITCPSAAASAVGSRTVTISNAPADAKVFVTAGSLQQGFALVSASIQSACTLSASFLNVTTANISTSALTTLHYLIVN